MWFECIFVPSTQSSLCVSEVCDPAEWHRLGITERKLGNHYGIPGIPKKYWQCRALECNQFGHMRSNFSMVRLKKIWGRTDAICRSRKKKVSATLKVSLWINNKHTLGPYRDLNQSEIVKGGPPSDWPWSRYSCTCVCVWKCVCCCSQTEREVSSRDACSVANLATFQTPLAMLFFFKSD